MKLISAFIFALGVYLASVNGDGDGPVKPVENAVSETRSIDAGSGKPPAIFVPPSANVNGSKPVEPAVAPDSEKSSPTVDTLSASTHSVPEIASPKPSSIPVTPSSSSKPPAPFPTTTSIPVNPQPDPERLSWNVTEGNNTCILLTGKLELELTWMNHTDSMVVTNQSRAEGSCKDSYIRFIFGPSDVTTLTITFSKNDSDKDYFVRGIEVVYLNETHFKNETLKLFVTPLNKSYSCTPNADVFISKKKVGNLEVSVSLKVSELKVQAFKTSKGSDFDSGIDCESHYHTPDIVPIIVGCALALLVIAVLAAYLISRRRSQARGYLSM